MKHLSLLPQTAVAAVLTLSALAVSAPEATIAQSHTCAAEVRQMARTYNVRVQPADIEDLDTEDLVDSGGVVEPPATNDPAVIRPPNPPVSVMPTAPDITSGETPNALPNNALSASDRLVLEAILMAAHAGAERGDDAFCRERLRAAKDLLG